MSIVTPCRVLFGCIIFLGASNAMGQAIDPQRLANGRIALGAADQRSLSKPARDTIYSCNRRVMGEAGERPWADRAGVIDFNKKPKVEGRVQWQSELEIVTGADTAQVQGNGLPAHPTGIFPVETNSDAYRFDRNPNAIRAHRLGFALPLNPEIAAEPGCLPMGVIGIALTGAVFFNALDAPGRDAVLHEIFDGCEGHPERNGRYHYHHDSPCFDQGDTKSHSPLIGYALDGFGIYGSRDAGGRYISNAQLDECHGHMGPATQADGVEKTIYHYHVNREFPYTLGCYRGTATTSARPRDRRASPAPKTATFSVTILGSGGPRNDETRAGPSNLIRIGNRFALIDMGRDTQRRIEQADIRLRDVDALLFTHHHLDHNEEFVPILLKGRLQGGAQQIIGPPGTRSYTQAVLDLYREDSDYRARRTGRSGDDIRRVEIRELRGGESFSLLGAQIQTAQVDHTIHTIAYRIDHGGKSIVISGDLTYSESLIALAKNADVLVIDSGQIGVARRGGGNERNNQADAPDTPRRRNRGPQAHASLTEVAQMAQKAMVKKLLLSHLPPRQFDETAVKDHVAQFFSGDVIVARDLLTIAP